VNHPRPTTRSRVIALLLVAVALVALAAGCGIPTEANARPIDRNALPQTLVEQPTTTTTPSGEAGLSRIATVFLVSTKGDTTTAKTTMTKAPKAKSHHKAKHHAKHASKAKKTTKVAAKSTKPAAKAAPKKG